MAAADRGEPASLVLRGYGRTIAIDAPAATRAAMHASLPPSFEVVDAEPEQIWSVAPAADGGWLASRGTEPLARRERAGDAAVIALSDLELWVGANAERRIFVHAACVVHDGAAILLPGATMAGKTTLCLALVQAGATYYSDEFAVLTPEGLVEPYRRPPALRAAADPPAPPAAAEPADLGPVPIATVALLQYRDGAGWQVTELSTARGVLGLFANTLAAQTRPQEALEVFGRAVPRARFLSGVRGAADQAAAALLAPTG